MNGPKLKWPNEPGKALIPLSPHNQEIGEANAKADQNFLEAQKRKKEKDRQDGAKSGRRGKDRRIFVSKAAGRADEKWERRIWATINCKGLNELRWTRSTNNLTGERSFYSEDRQILIVCDQENRSSWLISRGDREKYSLVTIKMGKNKAHPMEMPVLQSLIWQTFAEQTALRSKQND